MGTQDFSLNSTCSPANSRGAAASGVESGAPPGEGGVEAHHPCSKGDGVDTESRVSRNCSSRTPDVLALLRKAFWHHAAFLSLKVDPPDLDTLWVTIFSASFLHVFYRTKCLCCTPSNSPKAFCGGRYSSDGVQTWVLPNSDTG